MDLHVRLLWFLALFLVSQLIIHCYHCCYCEYCYYYNTRFGTINGCNMRGNRITSWSICSGYKISQVKNKVCLTNVFLAPLLQVGGSTAWWFQAKQFFFFNFKRVPRMMTPIDFDVWNQTRNNQRSTDIKSSKGITRRKNWQFWGCRNPALCQWFEEQILKNRQAPIFLMICHDFPADLPYINLKNPHFQTQPYDISVYNIPNMYLHLFLVETAFSHTPISSHVQSIYIYIYICTLYIS